MKKAATLCILFVLLCFYGYAQRYADLDIVQTSPVSHDTIVAGQQYTFTFLVRDLGADSVKVTDSLALYLIFNNDTVFFAVNGLPSLYHPLPGTSIRVGDWVSFSMPIYFDVSYEGALLDICTAVSFIHHSADPIYDTITTNNSTCATGIRIVPPLSIINVNKQLAVQVYPNPATDHIIFHLPGTHSGHSEVEIMNAIGQVLIQQQEDNDLVQVSTAMLPGGIYYYRLSTGKGTPATGKFVVGK